MLYFILVWVLLGGLCCVAGTAGLQWVKTPCLNRLGDRFILALWLGIIFLSISNLAVSLMFPLSPLVGGIVAAVWIGFAIASASVRQELKQFILSLQSWRIGLTGLVLMLGVALITTQPVTWLDTGLYHLGSIRWIASYGAVPGVGLIHDRLGFTSSWFSFTAPWSPKPLDLKVTAVTNGFLLVVALLHLGIALQQGWSRQARLADWFILTATGILIPLLMGSHLFREILISPSPDIPMVWITVAIAWSILLITDPQFSFYPILSSKLPCAWITLILALGAFSIKLSGIPLIGLAAAFYLIQNWKQWRSLVIGAISVSIIILPMFGFGIITTGCPLYPLSVLCLDLPWKIPTAYAQGAIALINGWGAWFEPAPSGIPTFIWVIMQWFQLSLMNQFMAFLLVASLGLLLFFIRQQGLRQMQSTLWIMALGAIGSGFILVTAPGIRFGLGYLILIPSFLSALYLFRLAQKWQPTIDSQLSVWHRSRSFFSGFIPIFCFGVLIFWVMGTDAKIRILLPPAVTRIEVVSDQVNDVDYHYPKNYEEDVCWGTELPCALGPLELDLKLRNPSRGIGAGFQYANGITSLSNR